MVLTVTLNPLLERRLFFDSVRLNSVNRAKEMELKSGGKGLNVSRQLSILGIDNIALTFLGGSSGKKIRHILHEEGINHKAISTKAETRAASLIIDKSRNSISSYFEPDNEVTESEAGSFFDALSKMINNCSIIVLAGSSPSENTDFIFPEAVKLANKLDKVSILDTYGRHMKESIEAGPTVVHNNISETENSLCLNFNSDEKKLDYLNFLYSKNVKMTFLTDGPRPFFVSKFDFHYKVTPPSVSAVDSTGSGDAFTAGVCYGWEKSMVFNDFVRFSAALGAGNSSETETCSVSRNLVESLLPKTEIKAIGKKMKLIDDTPNY